MTDKNNNSEQSSKNENTEKESIQEEDFFFSSNEEEKERKDFVEKDEIKSPKIQKKKTGKIVAFVIAALFIAMGGFFGGYFTYAATLDDGMRSLIWAKEQIDSKYNYEISNEEFYSAVFDGVNSLLDPYSCYQTADEYEEFILSGMGNRSGIGIVFLATADEKGLRVVRVTGNSPAERAGIQDGDYFVAYLNNNKERVIFTDFSILSSYLASCKTGEEITFIVSHDNIEREVQMAKEEYVENSVFYRSKNTAFNFTGEKGLTRTETTNILSDLEEDTAYIRLTGFTRTAGSQFGMAMSIFRDEHKKNLVLDLRGNGGGYMDVLTEIASYFCKNSSEVHPVIAKAVYKNGKTEKFKANCNVYQSYFSSDSIIYVLADNGTASASECLIGCMIDYGSLSYENIYLSERSTGKYGEKETKTYGKGIMQNTYTRYPLGSSDAIKLTVANILWPVSGNCIHGVGITLSDGAKQVEENYDRDAEIMYVLSKI